MIEINPPKTHVNPKEGPFEGFMAGSVLRCLAVLKHTPFEGIYRDPKFTK